MTPSGSSYDFGIGAQVFVREASDEDPAPWPGEPGGIIIGIGGAAIQSVTDSGGPTRLWLVQFDSPQRHLDGTEAHESAQIPEKYLELLPPIGA